MAWFRRSLFIVSLFLLLSVVTLLVVIKINERNRELPSPSQIKVEVLNGCGIPKLASKMRVFLVEGGFNVIGIDDTEQTFDKTIIVEHSDPKMRNAIVLSRFTGCKNVMLQLDSLMFSHVTIIIGKDYKKFLPESIKVFQ